MELAKQSITEELKALHQDTTEDEPEALERGRQNIMRKIAKLKPGGSTQIQALKRADGHILTDAKEMATELTDHWAPTFVQRAIDKDDLSRWIHELKAHDSLPSICSDTSAARHWKIRA